MNQIKYKKIEKVGFDEPVGWEKEPYTNLSDISDDSNTDTDTETERETDTETETDQETEQIDPNSILREETDFIIRKKKSSVININTIKNGSCTKNPPITSRSPNNRSD
jgi:hypothetical protein